MTEFHKIAKTGDLAPGEVNVYEVEGHRVALCNVDGEFYAIEDVCTHDAGPL
ncbi:MAG: Rieske 2Fe-2S domain-containing protein, partial [Actinomycetota bacterium]|nr:Rieske 2Fe-2S domain-containing protein [Actinomycetota bacterium]